MNNIQIDEILVNLIGMYHVCLYKARDVKQTGTSEVVAANRTNKVLLIEVAIRHCLELNAR